MPSTHKKVIIRKMSRDTINGYVAPAKLVTDGQIELLNTSGNVVRVGLSEVKCVYFVREFSEVDSNTRKTFTSRPRTEGLWVRLRFKDNDMLEGLMPNDLTQISNEGFTVNPPDTRGNTQRMFIPRSALSSLTVLAVIGGMSGRRRPAKDQPQQVQLFTE